MLTQKPANLASFQEGVKKRFKQLINISPKYSKFSLAGKLMALAIIFLMVPGVSHAFDTNLGSTPQPIKTQIQFDPTNPLLLSEKTNPIDVEIGISNFEITQKPVLATSTQVLYPDGHAHSDPTIFRPIYMTAGKQFNVPWQLIEAVHQVESGKSGSTNKRSYAGAVGPMQFMPGTWRAYAVDGDGDGEADITNVTDAIYTAANYLAKSGADKGHYSDAVFNYNHSQSYVNKVLGIAYEIGLPK